MEMKLMDTTKVRKTKISCQGILVNQYLSVIYPVSNEYQRMSSSFIESQMTDGL